MQVLPPYVQIQNLLGTYAERLDAGDFAGVAELFAHAAITVERLDTHAAGVAEVQALYEQATRRFPDDGTPHTKHVTTNLIIEIDDAAGSASCRSYFSVFQMTPDLPLQPIIQGRYRDRFESVDGRWRFAHRHMITDLVGNLSQHLLHEINLK
ncbi:MAG: nuclear transport factor 2 family protein [Candidatus Binatia bacterium]